MHILMPFICMLPSQVEVQLTHILLTAQIFTPVQKVVTFTYISALIDTQGKRTRGKSCATLELRTTHAHGILEHKAKMQFDDNSIKFGKSACQNTTLYVVVHECVDFRAFCFQYETPWKDYALTLLLHVSFFCANFACWCPFFCANFTCWCFVLCVCVCMGWEYLYI